MSVTHMVSQCALYHSKRPLISIWSCVEVTATKPTWCNSEYQNTRTIAPPCILRLLVTFLVGLGWCPSPSPFSPLLSSPLLSPVLFLIRFPYCYRRKGLVGERTVY
ncbi:uncharacterized protein SEPMUDRAFT_147064 [Sphaerulina musiva SO2202]|uniref:Uncharacterized protein n=1 Tax=Sphaerulina musiva (strain SO2202) TaxID=692275 RepID=M3CMQ9_SPHMS|nr:uncharacterized protein SEPMUDRAFT_147064 [Sphaerulina musiva SO2202]EMF15098.1 hypothetical protein SEPMUDRAFT_147064 [Sphaerulina musiva SO2202]